MQNRIAIAALLLTCLAVPPATRAQTVGVAPPLLSVGEARDIAVMNGVIYIRKIEYDERRWKVQGRDQAGRRVEMQIDPLSGEVIELNRFD
jgi:peptidase YpeB-like protein